jgi:hypothetical protein
MNNWICYSYGRYMRSAPLPEAWGTPHLKEDGRKFNTDRFTRIFPVVANLFSSSLSDGTIPVMSASPPRSGSRVYCLILCIFASLPGVSPRGRGIKCRLWCDTSDRQVFDISYDITEPDHEVWIWTGSSHSVLWPLLSRHPWNLGPSQWFTTESSRECIHSQEFSRRRKSAVKCRWLVLHIDPWSHDTDKFRYRDAGS